MFETISPYTGRTISKSYIDAKYFKQEMDCPIYFKLQEQDYLYESLKTSLSLNDALEKLSYFAELGLIYELGATFTLEIHKTRLIEFFMPIEYYNNVENNKFVKDKTILLRKTIESIGYFIASETPSKYTVDGNSYDVVWFSIHPLYIIEVTDEVYESDYVDDDGNLVKCCNGVLYHITLKRNMNHIAKYGLIPRNSNLYKDNYPLLRRG